MPETYKWTGICLIVVIAFYTCNMPSVYDDPSLMSNLRFSPSAFDSFKTNTEINYTLKVPACVSVYIVKKDPGGNELLVKTIITNAYVTKGSHSHTWLGDTEKGLFAPVGTYFGVIQIQQKRFETTVLVFHF